MREVEKKRKRTGKREAKERQGDKKDRKQQKERKEKESISSLSSLEIQISIMHYYNIIFPRKYMKSKCINDFVCLFAL